MKRPARMPSQLSEPLHRQLNSYALAASTAGVSLLALAYPSEAKIIYTHTHRAIDRFHPVFHLHFGSDKMPDFEIAYNYLSSHGNYRKKLRLTAVETGNVVDRVLGYYNSRSRRPFALALSRGAKIVSSVFPSKGNSATLVEILANSNTRKHWGYWSNVTDRYLGLAFQIHGKTHYGWVRLSVQSTGHATLTGYAYETIPNKPIIAGQTHGKDERTLGRLAQGASGVAVRRQEQ